MKSLIFLTVLAVCGLVAPEMAPLLSANSEDLIPGEYIVVFKDTISDTDVSVHMTMVKNMMSYFGVQANNMVGEYHIGSFHGYAAKMDDRLRDLVREMDDVKYVEVGQTFHTMTCTQQSGAIWGLVRTTHRALQPTVTDYNYDDEAAGSGVDVYILDTGIETTHPDFGGRARWGADFTDPNAPLTDQNGHGTHVAGTVMSNTWGIAKKATAIAVRVLGANGGGTYNGVIAGVQWVANQHSSGKKSVANMSLGGGRSTAVNDAVDAAVDKGIHFVVAAGNSAADACNYSPASSAKAITVGASDSSDQFASFSNYGRCEDIIAPGVDVTSTWLNGGSHTISGTSMASPHVAGVVAKRITKGNISPEDMKNLLQSEATPLKVTGVPCHTPNLLVFNECV